MKRFFAVRLLALFAILAGLMSAGRVNAQSTSGPFTTSTPISATTTDYTGTLTFPVFDHTLGTLLSVTISIQNTLTGTMTINNVGSSNFSGNCLPAVEVGFTDANGNLNPTPYEYGLPTAGSLTATVVGKKFTFSNVTPGNSATSPSLSATMTATSTFDSFAYSGVIQEFTGNSGGTFTLSLSTSTLGAVSIVGGGGNWTLSPSISLAITGTVTYTYAP